MISASALILTVSLKINSCQEIADFERMVVYLTSRNTGQQCLDGSQRTHNWQSYYDSTVYGSFIHR